MADNVNPNTSYPDQSREGRDATVASTPAEPGSGRLDETATAPANPWPDPVEPDISTVMRDTPGTPGLAPSRETLGALRETWPAARPFDAPEWMGSPEPGRGYEIPPDGNPKNWPPGRSAVER